MVAQIAPERRCVSIKEYGRAMGLKISHADSEDRSQVEVNQVAASPISVDMPYGPDYKDLPHQDGLVVIYADGHSKFARSSDKELTARKGGTWWDLVHEADGQ